MQEEIQKMIDECFLDCGFGGSYKAKTRLVNALLALIKKHERAEKDVCTLGCTKQKKVKE